MANPPVASIYGQGQTVASGYPVFVSKDSAGTMVTPNGNYVWNPNSNLWVPWSTDSNGNPQVSLSGSNTINANILKTTAANTATQLPNIACHEITLIGLKTNTGTVYVGGSNVSSTVFGTELDQKDSHTFAVSNANMLYISTPTSGDGVSYVAV